MRRRLLSLAAIFVASAASLLSQTAELTVVNAAPTGEIQQLQQAGEIRIVFSEPMVPLGRIPSNPALPWIRIAPALAGAFRWSGTTTLLFTPASPPPFATRYRVTVDRSATSAAGRQLRAPFEFTFTTPTVRLTSVRWARKNGRFNDPVTLAVSVNQPVVPADLLAHLTIDYRAHDLEVPTFTSRERARLAATDPDGLRRFDEKVALARRNAARTDAVAVRLATDWDRTLFRQTNETTVMLETADVPPPGTTLGLTLDARVTAAQGREVPGIPQTSQAPLADAFFAIGVDCRAECTPSQYNPIGFTGKVAAAGFAAALSATDITDAAREVSVPKNAAGRPSARDVSVAHSVEDAGFTRQPPARTWALRLDPSLTADDGQTLGYPWLGIVENWNDLAFTSFGDGHGVWETGGGSQLPFYSRNYRAANEWAVRIAPGDLMPRLIELEKQRFEMHPPGDGTRRPLAVRPNQIQSFGFDLAPAMGKSRTGLYWAGLQPADPIERAKTVPRLTSSMIQVTNLGITVKDSPQSTLVFVTALDTGAPVDGATVAIISTANTALWRGRTNRDGIALAPALRLRKASEGYGDDLRFLVTAEKGGDVAYVASNWNEGIQPWNFDQNYSLWESADILRGSVFTDRGVYKPGEPVQVKAILRFDTPAGVRLLAAGSRITVRVRDSRNKDVDQRTVTINRWSSAEWAWTVPSDATLGRYQIEARIPGTETPASNDAVDREPTGDWLKAVSGDFLVAAYRRPDFQVDVKLNAPEPLAGATLSGSATAAYLFGGTMAKRPVKWTLSRTAAIGDVPAAITERFPRDAWTFAYMPERRESEDSRVAGEDAVLNAAGGVSVALPTERSVDLPYRYTFEADVEDLSRQHIANRASLVLHPASVYLGLRRSDEFASVAKGAATEIVAVDLDGRPVAGIDATVALVRVQWNSVRRAEGGGFYTWDSERIEIPIGEWPVTSAATPVPLALPIPEGGSYVVRITARDRDGRRARTDLNLYAMGAGYTAWERYDDNRITLEPEKKSWRPGETARIMIKSPWERATALLTVEREGIRHHRRFTLTSTQQTVEVPVTAADIPNIYVSVLLVRGRTSDDPGADGGDPGKPAFRLGYTELTVVDDLKRLALKVSADREEYRPANTAKVSVAVTDAAGKGAASEVTLWAVDQGVLALTEYNAPDVARAIYVQKALQVMNEDSRERLISRRVLTPKGGDQGGGGGAEGGARTDFRPLAFWLGSVETDRRGRATRTVTLPDSLTTYRIMAVAGDAVSRFGSAVASLRVTKPVTLLPAFPRFLTLSDRASFGTLVGNTQRTDVDAVVTIRSLDPSLLEIQGAASVSLHLPAGGTTTVRFETVARGIGRARVRVDVTAGANTDAFETTVPVGAPARLETTAAFGDTVDRAVERLVIPAGGLPSAGGLTVDLASSALVGLGEGARYLADYPFGCAEQKASAALALALAADLGSAFSMGRIAPADYRTRAQSLLRELPRYQCADGGFGYWPGNCRLGDYYLTSYVLHVLRVTKAVGVEADVPIAPALGFLQAQLRAAPPAQVDWLPAWSAAEAFAVKVLAEYGEVQDANVTRLLDRVDRMPVFALSYLADAMAATPARHPRYADVVRRLANAISVEGDRAHVQELDSDALIWLWNSNVRSSALVLEGLVRRGDDPRVVPGLVRGLLLARQNGRWRNTQENATALEALVGYYRKFEAEAPDFTATVSVGGRMTGTAAFRGRSSASQRVQIDMPDLLTQVAAGTEAELAISRAGTGRAYYTARLQYQPSTPLPLTDQGIRLERRYERVVEGTDASPASTTFAAGDLVRVTLAFTLPKERRYVAVTDPLAAGFEAVDGWFKTTAADLATDASAQSGDDSWLARWRKGGFDFVDKYDDRVVLFATRLSEGRHEFSYVVRATTAGVFAAAGAWAEEMYAPDVNGRSAPATVTIK